MQVLGSRAHQIEVEGTSGSTGISLCLAAAERGYKVRTAGLGFRAYISLALRIPLFLSLATIRTEWVLRIKICIIRVSGVYISAHFEGFL